MAIPLTVRPVAGDQAREPESACYFTMLGPSWGRRLAPMVRIRDSIMRLGAQFTIAISGAAMNVIQRVFGGVNVNPRRAIFGFSCHFRFKNVRVGKRLFCRANPRKIGPPPENLKKHPDFGKC